jgi:hypothetical protein
MAVPPSMIPVEGEEKNDKKRNRAWSELLTSNERSFE